MDIEQNRKPQIGGGSLGKLAQFEWAKIQRIASKRIMRKSAMELAHFDDLLRNSDRLRLLHDLAVLSKLAYLPQKECSEAIDPSVEAAVKDPLKLSENAFSTVRFFENDSGGLWRFVRTISAAIISWTFIFTYIYAVFIVAGLAGIFTLIDCARWMFGASWLGYWNGAAYFCGWHPLIGDACASYPALRWIADTPVVAVSCLGFGIGLAVGLLAAVFYSLSTVQAFGYVDRERRLIVLVFRGSRLIDNFTINALFAPKFLPRRHLGFWSAWSRVEGAIRVWLEGQPPFPIAAAGHSLGGALAQIAAYNLAGKNERAGERAIELVASFASSPVGGGRFVPDYNARPLKGESAAGNLHDVTHHFTYGADIIPRLAPPYLFHHVGQRYWMTDYRDILPIRPPFVHELILQSVEALAGGSVRGLETVTQPFAYQEQVPLLGSRTADGHFVFPADETFRRPPAVHEPKSLEKFWPALKVLETGLPVAYAALTAAYALAQLTNAMIRSFPDKAKSLLSVPIGLPFVFLAIPYFAKQAFEAAIKKDHDKDHFVKCFSHAASEAESVVFTRRIMDPSRGMWPSPTIPGWMQGFKGPPASPNGG